MDRGHRIEERWEITAVAPGEPAVGRWRASTLATGEPVEVLALQPAAAWSRAAHGAFLDVHRTIQRANDPALVKVHAVGWATDHAWVVRAPLEDLTLDDVPGPLAPGVVAGIGVRLLPAVLAADAATGALLLPRDVGFDAFGAAVLAPRARPGDRVAPEDTRHIPPEAYGGGRPDGAAGLYGLGVILYRLTTGRDPIRGGGPAHAGNWVAGLPPALDRALQALLDADPGRRATALPLLAEVAGAVPDLRRLARKRPAAATVVSSEVKITSRTSSSRTLQTRVSAQADVASPRSAVVVPAAELGRLSPADRSALAGHAALPLQILDRLTREGMPLVLAVERSRGGAGPRADALAREIDRALAVERSPGILFPAAILILATVAFVLGVFGTVFGFVALFGAALTSLLLGLAVGLQWRHRALAWGTTLSAWKALRERPLPSPRVAPRWERLAVLRRELASSPMPETAATDVRSALRDVEQHLVDLERIEGTVEDALSSVRAADLRSRVAALSSAAGRDPKAAEERDRLERTLADVEAVQGRQDRLRADLDRVDDALDDLAAVLAEISTRPEATDGLDALRTTTRIARDALGSPARPPPREEE